MITYIVDYKYIVSYAYIHSSEEIPIHLDLQKVLKILSYFQKASEESNITKQEINIWRLGKNNFDK